jgi:hypothetical protein
MGQTVAYTVLLNIVLLDGWLKQEHLKQNQNENEMKVNSITQQFLKEAQSFTPLLLNVFSSSDAQSTQTQGLYPKCIQVATAFCTNTHW